MKDRENVLRQLDEADNMIMIIDQAVKNGNNLAFILTSRNAVRNKL